MALAITQGRTKARAIDYDGMFAIATTNSAVTANMASAITMTAVLAEASLAFIAITTKMSCERISRTPARAQMLRQVSRRPRFEMPETFWTCQHHPDTKTVAINPPVITP